MEMQGCVSLREMCEGIRDERQVRQEAGKEVGSARVKPQSDLGDGEGLELQRPLESSNFDASGPTSCARYHSVFGVDFPRICMFWREHDLPAEAVW